MDGQAAVHNLKKDIKQMLRTSERMVRLIGIFVIESDVGGKCNGWATTLIHISKIKPSLGWWIPIIS